MISKRARMRHKIFPLIYILQFRGNDFMGPGRGRAEGQSLHRHEVPCDEHELGIADVEDEHSDFQLICGTNRNLMDAVTSGKFRRDLLARIDLWSFKMPGLAERREDIEPNLDSKYLSRFGLKFKNLLTA